MEHKQIECLNTEIEVVVAEYKDPKRYFSNAGMRAAWLVNALKGVRIEVHRNKKKKSKPNPTVRLYAPNGTELLSIRVRSNEKKGKGSGSKTLKLHYENNLDCFGGDVAKKNQFESILLSGNFDIDVTTKDKGDHDVIDLDEEVNKAGLLVDYSAIFAALRVFDEWREKQFESKDTVSGQYTEDERVLRSINARRGQPDFRKRLLRAYESRCAVTGCKLEEALEAAHIIPHSEEINYETSRGILLRSDIHTLFDLHLISVAPVSGKVVVCDKCKVSYNEFHGASLFIPEDEADRPNAADLMSHYKLWCQKNDAVG